MIKTLTKAQKMEREKFRIPRSVQDAIPIHRIYADGIFQVGNQYSKTWSFTDINYAIAGKEDKTAMFLDYSELLNALDSGASAKITIYNRRINKAEFERSVLLPDKDDGLDEYRHEFNQMLTAQVTGTSNSIVRERYLTVSVVKRNADEARSYFARVGTDLVTHLAQLSSVATELTLVTLDAIYNRVIRNWKSGKTTWIFCDEFYVLFRYEYSANFFYKLWKRIDLLRRHNPSRNDSYLTTRYPKPP